MSKLPRDILLGFLLVCALALTAMSLRWLRPADQAAYDLQMRLLRAHEARPLPRDVVVIGVDEISFEAIAEPYALWHRQFGALLMGLAAAKPAVVGLAVPLPVRSYEFLVKGIDAPLLDGLRALDAATSLVIGQPPGLGQRLRPLAAEIAAAAPKAKLASLAICEDTDGVVRRIHQRRCRSEDERPPLAHQMAKALGREGSPSGLIDYSVGGPIEFTPLGTVLGWLREGRGDKLAALVEGRPVVVASVLPDDIRFRLPVALAAWQPASFSVPAGIVHVQALRAMLGRGLVERGTEDSSLLLAALAALAWFGRSGLAKSAAVGALALAVFGYATFSLWHGTRLYAGSLLIILLGAWLARTLFDSFRHLRERRQLRAAFAGHVSPQVMRAILRGRLMPDVAGERTQVTLLFADIHGFTARSARATPEASIALLNRFHAEAAAAVQARGGAIDRGIGDGVLATFGLPQPLAAPQRNALEAAQDLLRRIERLNRLLVADGQAALEIGIAVHCGDVLAGYVGSARRRDFSVIGDAVGAVERLEGLTLEVAYPVVCSRPVAAAVGYAAGMVDLGERELADGSRMAVAGWNPPQPEAGAGAG